MPPLRKRKHPKSSSAPAKSSSAPAESSSAPAESSMRTSLNWDEDTVLPKQSAEPRNEMPPADIGFLRSQLSAARYENNCMAEDLASIQREKAALQLAETQRLHLWHDQQDTLATIHVLLANPLQPVSFPQDEIVISFLPSQRIEVAAMAGFGHMYLGMHGEFPTYHAGLFLKCPRCPGAPIFALTQWESRTFHGGCIGCPSVGMTCPLTGAEFFYLRLKYGDNVTIAWVPENWITRVLSHATIP